MQENENEKTAASLAASNNIAPRVVKIEAALRQRLERAWNEQTSAGGYTPQTVSKGQCAVTAMVVQDLLGGDLLRVMNAGESHYYNRLPDGRELDLTRDQFSVWDPEPAVIRERAYVEASEQTMQRYRLLCQRLALHPNPM